MRFLIEELVPKLNPHVSSALLHSLNIREHLFQRSSLVLVPQSGYGAMFYQVNTGVIFGPVSFPCCLRQSPQMVSAGEAWKHGGEVAKSFGCTFLAILAKQ